MGCGSKFPIIEKIAILQDFESYLSNRPSLGGDLMISSKSPKMKAFVKATLAKTKPVANDISKIEKRWALIYESNKKSKFYQLIKNSIDSLNFRGTAVEHGCSIGMISDYVAKTGRSVFGIDKSFHALLLAKKSSAPNLDFFVADSMDMPFGKKQFDLVVALNIFELIEPKPLLSMLAKQVCKNGSLVLSDPYDFERGARSVREPVGEETVRKMLERKGFALTKNTKKPNRLPWSLRLYDRAVLQYRVDLIIGKKQIARRPLHPIAAKIK